MTHARVNFPTLSRKSSGTRMGQPHGWAPSRHGRLVCEKESQGVWKASCPSRFVMRAALFDHQP